MSASTCPAVRACCTRPVTPRGASRCTSRATRRCLVGDVLCSRNPLTGRQGVQLMPAAFAASSAQALASIDQLESVEAAVIGFGHGDPWRGGVSAAVADARATGRT